MRRQRCSWQFNVPRHDAIDLGLHAKCGTVLFDFYPKGPQNQTSLQPVQCQPGGCIQTYGQTWRRYQALCITMPKLLKTTPCMKTALPPVCPSVRHLIFAVSSHYIQHRNWQQSCPVMWSTVHIGLTTAKLYLLPGVKKFTSAFCFNC